jgi:hypothetical protein
MTIRKSLFFDCGYLIPAVPIKMCEIFGELADNFSPYPHNSTHTLPVNPVLPETISPTGLFIFVLMCKLRLKVKK